MEILRKLVLCLLAVSLIMLVIGDLFPGKLARYGLYGVGVTGACLFLMNRFSKPHDQEQMHLNQYIGILSFPKPTVLVVGDLGASADDFTEIGTVSGDYVINADISRVTNVDVLDRLTIRHRNSTGRTGKCNSQFEAITESGYLFVGLREWQHINRKPSGKAGSSSEVALFAEGYVIARNNDGAGAMRVDIYRDEANCVWLVEILFSFED
jgi:hypothetical protein